MAAGNEREALLLIADRLCAELGRARGLEEAPPERSGLGVVGAQAWGALSPEDEVLVAAVRGCLAKIAAAVWTASPEAVAERAVRAALDGAELVMRGELASGNAAQLARLMPSFVYLVTLPLVEQDKALELAQRTSELIGEGSES